MIAFYFHAHYLLDYYTFLNYIIVIIHLSHTNLPNMCIKNAHIT